jgi:hypothetical protein
MIKTTTSYFCLFLLLAASACGDLDTSTDEAVDDDGDGVDGGDEERDSGADNEPDDEADAGGGDGGAGTLAIDLVNPIHVVPESAPDGANGSEDKPFADLYAATAAILADPSWDGTMIVHAGLHQLPDTVTVPRTADLELMPGATLAMGYKANFNAQRDVQMLGEQDANVTFTWLQEGQHWGSFTLFEEESQENVFQYVTFAHGGEGQFKGIGVRGALSLENAGGLITDCLFLENEGDDALSLGNSSTLVENTLFIDSFLDAIDVDGQGGTELANNFFDRTGNDAIDCGEGATFFAHGNVMINTGDKGISVGEQSAPILANNLIVGGFIGIGVKDGSTPYMVNNTVYGSTYGYASYESIAGSGAGQGTFINGIIWGSERADVTLVGGADEFSYSCIESGAYSEDALVEDDAPGAASDAGAGSGAGDAGSGDADSGDADSGDADSGESNDGGGGVTTSSGLIPFTGEGMISPGSGCDDPLFADPENGDFHLMSTGGRYVAEDDAWVQDDVSSPCIDTGSPDEDLGVDVADETTPNGGRLNMGAYGGTAQASRSPE